MSTGDQAKPQQGGPDRAERLSLRAANLNVALGVTRRPDERELRALDSSLKRNTAFVKKLKSLSEDACESLCTEIASLNLSKYVSEMASAVAEAKLPRPADISAAVKVCSLLHQRYAEFSQLLPQELLKAYRETGAALKSSDPARQSRQRVLVRLLAELTVAGVCPDLSPLGSMLKDAVRPEEQAPAGFALLPVVVAFVRATADDVLGVGGKTPEAERVGSPEHRAAMGKICEAYFAAACRHLAEQHEALGDMEHDNRVAMETKGEVAESQTAAYEVLRKNYEKLVANISMLADLLGQAMPQMPERESLTRITEAADKPAKGETEPPPMWENEATRTFYECLPDLAELVPASVLHKGDKTSDVDKPIDPSEVAADAESDEKASSAMPVPETPAVVVVSAMMPGSMSVDRLLKQLPECLSRDLIDSAAVDWCYLNTRPNRKKLLRALFAAPRTMLGVLPYYCRLVAALTPVCKDLAPGLVTLLDDEFKQLLTKKDSSFVESKIRNARYIGELTKFKLCPRDVVFNCLRSCIDDFGYWNIETLCTLIDTCGRFLYRSPETHVRTKNLLEIMMRLKSAKNLDPRSEAMVETAYFQCVPPDRCHKDKPLTPVQKYIRHLLWAEFNASNGKKVVHQLRMLDWDQYEDYTARCLVNVHKYKFSDVPLLASLIAGLARHNETLTVKCVDLLMEDILDALERNETSEQQKRIVQMKLLGELYNFVILDSPIIFDTLYLLITHGHDAKSVSSGESARLDDTSDFFRIRLVCTLLNTCGGFWKKGKTARRLDRFLVFFNRYLLTKDAMPTDVSFMVDDCFEALRPALKRPQTIEEADAALHTFFEQEQANIKATAAGEMAAESSDDESQENSEEEDAAANEDAASSDEDSNSEVDDVDEEDTSSSDESDEEEKQRIADREIERELERIVEEGVARRAGERKKFDVHIPPGIIDAAASAVPSRKSSKDQQPQQPAGLAFTLLVKKGSKPQTKEIVLPSECPLVQTAQTTQRQAQEEKDRLKRQILSSVAEEEAREAIQNALTHDISSISTFL
eukprot:m51a1_g6690 putative regulator of nonsense transcripts 2 isoform 1 (1041) ;mRNA; f:59987-65738